MRASDYGPDMAVRCGHCGREGTVSYLGQLVLSERTTTIHHEPGGHVEEVPDQTILHVARCSVCQGPTISTYRWIEDWSDPADYAEFTRVFPPVRELDDLPDRARERYESMLELLHAPDAFAVRAGRLLEAICADKGIVRGDLKDRIDSLVSGGTVPQALADQAHLVRNYRNVGGHDDDREVQADDVPLIRRFMEALLEYLYWGPAELERGRAALEARRRDG